MPTKPFTTYLETFRLRTGFSRSEIGFLLGAMDGKSVARHERLTRLPSLRMVLGYSVILGIPVDQLYEGLALEIRADLQGRARGLARRLSKGPNTKLREKKIALLRSLLINDEDEKLN